MILTLTVEEQIPYSSDRYYRSAKMDMSQIDDFRFGEDMLRTAIMRLVYELAEAVKTEVANRGIKLDEKGSIIE